MGLQHPYHRFDSGCRLQNLLYFARVVELAYTLDSKSNAFTGLWVRIPPRVYTKDDFQLQC